MPTSAIGHPCRGDGDPTEASYCVAAPDGCGGALPTLTTKTVVAECPCSSVAVSLTLAGSDALPCVRRGLPITGSEYDGCAGIALPHEDALDPAAPEVLEPPGVGEVSRRASRASKSRRRRSRDWPRPGPRRVRRLSGRRTEPSTLAVSTLARRCRCTRSRRPQAGPSSWQVCGSTVVVCPSTATDEEVAAGGVAESHANGRCRPSPRTHSQRLAGVTDRCRAGHEPVPVPSLTVWATQAVGWGAAGRPDPPAPATGRPGSAHRSAGRRDRRRVEASVCGRGENPSCGPAQRYVQDQVRVELGGVGSRRDQRVVAGLDLARQAAGSPRRTGRRGSRPPPSWRSAPRGRSPCVRALTTRWAILPGSAALSKTRIPSSMAITIARITTTTTATAAPQPPRAPARRPRARSRRGGAPRLAAPARARRRPRGRRSPAAAAAAPNATRRRGRAARLGHEPGQRYGRRSVVAPRAASPQSTKSS